jgi:excisionase family DNA binding protein
VSTKPAIQLEPTYTYAEVAKALGVSLALIKREAAANRLKHRRKGRFCVVTQTDIDDWWAGQYERSADKRTSRVTRRDQQVSPTPNKRRKAESYQPQADADILARLGLPTE